MRAAGVTVLVICLVAGAGQAVRIFAPRDSALRTVLTHVISPITGSVASVRSQFAAVASGAPFDSIADSLYRLLCPYFTACEETETASGQPLGSAQVAGAALSIQEDAPAQSGATTIAPAQSSEETAAAAINQYITQPVIERTIQTVPISLDMYVTQQQLAAQISDLSTIFSRELHGPSYPAPAPPASGGVWNSIALSNKIDNLSHVTISDSTISGGTITGASISGGSVEATSFSGLLGIGSGGTGTSSAPAYGQVLLGQSDGSYALVATSSLGITSGSGTFFGLSDVPGSMATGSILYASAPDTLAELPISSNGLALKLQNGLPVWATDLQGSGGAGVWATTTDSLAITSSDTSDVVLVGTNATSTAGNILEVLGNALFRNSLTAYGSITSPHYVATSSLASTFPFASSTALTATTGFFTTASTTNLTVSSVRNSLLFTDFAGVVSAVATSTLGLLTTDVAEGSNQYYTDVRVQTYLDTIAKGYFFATTSADYWKSTNNFFSTTSADAWDSTKWRWSTTSSDYWKNVNNFFSTSSADYWDSTKWRWSTSSSDLAVNTFIAASTTIPKTFAANSWTALQSFGSGASTSALTVSNAQNALLITNSTGVVSGTSTLAVNFGGTGSTTLAGLLKGNGTGAILTALPGTDYLIGSGVQGNCVKWGPGNTLADFAAGCGSGGGGGGGTGGTWATSTSPVAGELFNYPNFTTDIVVIGGTATTGASYYLDPNTQTSYFAGHAQFIFASTSVISADGAFFGTASTTNLIVSGSTQSNSLIINGSGTSTFNGGVQTSALDITGLGTSTALNGFNIASGCFAVNGVCVTGGSPADGSFSTTSADYWETTQWRWSTTSSDYWMSVNNFFSTTSADAWKNANNFFSTTSANYFESTFSRWATTSAAYFLGRNQGLAFSTTSAAYFLSQNQGAAFSTTSANWFVSSSTTIPKTFTANAFTALQSFGAGASTSALTISSIQNSLLVTSTTGVVSGTTTLSVPFGGTGSTTLGGILAGNGTGAITALTFGAGGLAFANNQLSILRASASQDGYLAQGDWTLFNSKISSSSLSATYPIQYNSATGVFNLAFGTTTANSWSALQTFNGGASTTNISASGIGYFTTASTTHLSTNDLSIHNLQGKLLATDGTGAVIATTSVGFNYITGVAGVSQGGTASTTLGGLLTGNGIGAVTSAIVAGPLQFASNQLSILQASASQDGYLSLGDWTNFNNKISSSSLSATYPIQYNSATGVFNLAFGTTTANSWSALQTFNGGASTTNISASGYGYFATASTTNLTVSGTATSTFNGGIQTTALNITGSATSTFGNGINLNTGCFSIAGACISGGAGVSLGVANTWTALQTVQAGVISQASSTFSAFTNLAGGASTTNLSAVGTVYSGTASTTNLTISGIQSSLLKTITSGIVSAAVAGIDYLSPFDREWIAVNGSYLTPSSTIQSIIALASSTIGNGTQAGGLTIDGGATTTQLIHVLGVGTSTVANGVDVGTLNVTGTATSTFGNGINLNTGCFSIGGVCVGGGGGSGTVNGTGSTGQVAYYTGGTTVSPTSTLFIASNSYVGIGTTTPFSALTIAAATGPQFSLVDGTAANTAWTMRSINNNLYFATSTYSATSSISALWINQNGVVTIDNSLAVGTTSALAKASIDGTLGLSLKGGASPAGASGFGLLFGSSTDSQLYWKTPSGAEQNLGNQLSNIFTVGVNQTISIGDLVSYASSSAIEKGFSPNVNVSASGIIASTTSMGLYNLNTAEGMAVLDSTHIAVIEHAAATGIASVKVCSQSGNQLTCGTSVAFATSSTNRAAIARLDSSHFVVSYNNASTQWYAQAASVSGTTVTLGTKITVGSNQSSMFGPVALDSTHFVVPYNNSTSGDTEAFGFTVSGTTLTKGATTTLSTNGTNGGDAYAAMLYSTHFVTAYLDDNADPYAVVSSVSGTTITPGSPVALSGVVSPTDVPLIVEALDATHFIAGYLDGTSYYYRAASVSGTTISYGTAATLFEQHDTGSTVGSIALRALDATHFVSVWEHLSEGDDSYLDSRAVVGSLSGTTITFGNPAPVGKIRFDTVSQVAVSATYESNQQLAKLDETHIAFIGNDYDNGGALTAVIASVSGTNIVWGPGEAADPNRTAYSKAVIAPDATHIAFSYNDYGSVSGGGGSYLNAGYVLSFGTPLGVATQGGTDGDRIAVAYQGVVTGLSGLTPNTIYYANGDGTLTATSTGMRVGLALTSTSLLLNSSFQPSFNGGSGGTGGGSGVGGGSDLAEMYPTEDLTLAPGEILSFDPARGGYVRRASVDDDTTLAGIVTTDPAIVIGQDARSSGAMVSVLALAGRVPVRVNLEGGPIKIGDRIALSSMPGVGRKASSLEASVGVAMENFDGSDGSSTGSVMAFVNLQREIQSTDIAVALFGLPSRSAWDSASTTMGTSTVPNFTDGLRNFLLSRQVLLGSESGNASTTLVGTNKVTSTSTLSAAFDFVGAIFYSVLHNLLDMGVQITENFARIANLIADRFTVGSSEAPSGITLYDEATGEPYCFKIVNGASVTAQGICAKAEAAGAAASVGNSTSESAPPMPNQPGDDHAFGETAEPPQGDTESPVITITGENPAHIHVGDTYSDLGAIVTDNVDQNLGIKTYLNGTPVFAIILDTSVEATDMIDYVATDQAGNTATSTRAVFVDSAAPPPPPAPEEQSPPAGSEVNAPVEQEAGESSDSQNVPESGTGSAQSEAPQGGDTPSAPAEESLDDLNNAPEIDAPSITPDDPTENVAPVGTNEVTVAQ